MFMFRRKRTSLAKRLWRARIKLEYETRGQNQKSNEFEKFENHNMGVCCAFIDDFNFCTDEGLLRNSLIKRLKDNQLEILVNAVESRGASNSSCVLYPREYVDNPHLMCCQIWRWPDVNHVQEIKRLPSCESAKDLVYECINPYHFSRLCYPESPPPPYCRFSAERLKPEDRAPSEKTPSRESQLELRASLTTNGEGDRCGTEWCKLAYWELSQRIGRLYPVDTRVVNVFWDQPHGDGLSLAALAQHSFWPPESVRRNRNKIGLGITLSLEEDGVWVYNRSESPIFVNSPCLDDPDSRSLLVYRVPSGCCLNIFVPGLSVSYDNFGGPPTGPVDRNTVRISFAKGWGPKYSRQEVTSCPTWLEILLAPCR